MAEDHVRPTRAGRQPLSAQAAQLPAGSLELGKEARDGGESRFEKGRINALAPLGSKADVAAAADGDETLFVWNFL